MASELRVKHESRGLDARKSAPFFELEREMTPLEIEFNDRPQLFHSANLDLHAIVYQN